MNKILIVCGIVLQAAFIIIDQSKKYLYASILKGFAALCFVLLGITGSSWEMFPTLIVIGLICGMAGDIIVSFRYIYTKSAQKIHLLGIAAFLLGHIFYLSALVTRAGVNSIPIFSGLLLAILICSCIYKAAKDSKKLSGFGMIYVSLETFMAVYAIWNAWLTNDLSNVILACGAVLFLISDVGLIRNTYSEIRSTRLRAVNLSLYYIGQTLIAFSLGLRK